MFKKIILMTIVLALISGCEKDILSKRGKTPLPDKVPTTTHETVDANNSVMEIDWDKLIPESWLPDPKVVERYNNGELNDDDPEIIALREKIKVLEEKAPVNEALDGKIVKIAGYIVPIEMDNQLVREFLLVPYQGACIHSPPPPSNQTIYVTTDENSAGEYKTFDTVWVTGTINVQKMSHDLAETGFTIQSTHIELYE